MRLSGPVLLILLALPAVSSANELMRVYERALSQDTQLQAALHARDNALEARPQARAALLPQIAGSYSYSEGNSKGSSTQKGTGPGGEDITIANRFDSESTSEALSVSLNQTVFDWASFRAYSQAGDVVALAEAQYRAAEQDLVLRSAQTYFDLLAADDNLRFAKAEKAAVERQLEQAKRRFEVGLSAITDVQEAQARYDLTVAQEIQAEQALASAREGVKIVTGPEPTQTVALREDIPLQTPNPADVEQWVGAAKDNNLDLLVANLDTDIARKGVGIAQAGHLPTVGLRGSYSDTDNESGDRTQDAKGDSVGVTVNLPIFSGFLVQSQVRAAEATHEQRKSEQEGSRRAVDRLTRDAYLGVIAGASRVRALKQAVISSTTALEASETGLEVGTRTAVDVLNSQRDLYSAQRDYARARYDYLLSVLTLKSAAGRLGAADLNEIDQLLVR
jgi:outer membrane protein